MTPRSRPISTYFRPAPAASKCTTSSTIESPDTCSSSTDKCADDSEVVDNGYCDPSHGSVLAVMVGRLVHTPACRSSVCHLNRCGVLTPFSLFCRIQQVLTRFIPAKAFFQLYPLHFYRTIHSSSMLSSPSLLHSHSLHSILISV